MIITLDEAKYQSRIDGNSEDDEITADMAAAQRMNRLLQGDVGAGKTVVALYALLMAVADRKQGALMAPTELLAEQHHLSISKILEGTNEIMRVIVSRSMLRQ